MEFKVVAGFFKGKRKEKKQCAPLKHWSFIILGQCFFPSNFYGPGSLVDVMTMSDTVWDVLCNTFHLLLASPVRRLSDRNLLCPCRGIAYYAAARC